LHKNNAVNLGTNVNMLAQRSHKIIVVLLFFSLPLFAASQIVTGQPQNNAKLRLGPFPGLGGSNHLLSLKYVNNSFVQVGKPLGYNQGSMFPLVKGSYAVSLGFFCRQELKMDRMNFIPLRFRLGSVDYTDHMEGKFGGTHFHSFK
jgi:hypothetical protein